MKAAGIDYSMTSPAMVIWNESEYIFYYMNKTPSRLHTGRNLYSSLIHMDVSVSKDIQDEKIGSSIARFEKIADFFLSALEQHSITTVFLEGYALGAKGKVFSIAENTAVLKYQLMKQHMDVYIYPPTVIKKYATGKGNSNKEAMKNSFESAVKVPTLRPIEHYRDSPYTDCIDAYWILQYGLDSLFEK